MRIRNAILPGRDLGTRWDVEFEDNIITSIQAAQPPDESADPSPLLLPPLCHPHIHLDKAYLLTCGSKHCQSPGAEDNPAQRPDYSDLAPQDGTFDEALKFTSLAKQRYTPEDLYLRGAQLLATSLSQGVTSCRAFVEIDHVTRFLCLEAAIRLKDCFRGKLEVQICAFAQDPIFSTDHGHENRRILEDALDKYAEHIEVLGATPYVEEAHQSGLQNILWAVNTALERNLHLDFHLDYTLSTATSGQLGNVLDVLRGLNWKARADPRKTIVLGHCTHLTMHSDDIMARTADIINRSKLPIHFVGLPTSDLFMMGRPPRPSFVPDSNSANRPRGTLQVLDMIKENGLSCCLSVNNVGNAFTPWGTGDPLALASLGVGIYQAGTELDAKLLFACVSSFARKAIGLNSASSYEDQDSQLPFVSNTLNGGITTEPALTDLDDKSDNAQLREGRMGELLLVKNKKYVACPGHLGVKIPARQRISVRDVVWDPPEVSLRQILRC